jgi:hypothetical protein
MSLDDLLELVPSAARYRREELADEQNALSYWNEAAEALVTPDDQLLDHLLYGFEGEADETRAVPHAVDEATVARLDELVDQNQPTFALLREGVRCGRVQFPEFADEGGSIEEHYQSLLPLRQLARAWYALARLRIAERRYSEAAEELIGLGEMGHMICCGESFTMHYLIGSWILGVAVAGAQLLAVESASPSSAHDSFCAALDRWLAEADRMTLSQRVELCGYALPELARLEACPDVPTLVDQFLDRHYHNAPMLSEGDEEPATVREDDGRRAWRRETILALLEGHAEPFVPAATARQLGRLVADRIAELQRPGAWNIAGPWRRLGRSYRRLRFGARTRVWPAQLHPGFPFECLGPSEDAQRMLAELRPHVSPRSWNAMQPPTEAQLPGVRQRLQWMPNALGVLVVQALLSIDINVAARLNRHRLEAARQALRKMATAA